MSFNIWRSGGRSLERTISVLRSAAPDVVGLQECDRDTARVIAAQLEMDSAVDDDGNVILSRHPIARVIGRTRHPWGGLGVTVALSPERRVHVFDAHLHWASYGPYLLQEGRPAPFVLARERAYRMPGLHELLAIMDGALTSGEPTFLVGDFNAPSHLDYPDALAWPESVACHARGLSDSYRVLHPERRRYDPRTPFAFDEPGITWSPLTGEEPRGVFDRIDFVYFAAAKPQEAVELDALNSVEPWPSDHRAVLGTFALA